MERALLSRFLAGTALLLVSCGIARAQATTAVSREVSLYKAAVTSPAPATLAVSREVTLFKTDSSIATPATATVSREVTLYKAPTVIATPASLASSREVTLYKVDIASPAPATLAISRQLTLFRYASLADAILALRTAAGLHNVTPTEMGTLNVVTTGSSANTVDVLDSVAIDQKRLHPDTAR